jgi:hypothetical protein
MLTSQQEVIQLLFNRQCCATRSLQQTQDVKTSIALLKLADKRLGTLIVRLPDIVDKMMYQHG